MAANALPEVNPYDAEVSVLSACFYDVNTIMSIATMLSPSDFDDPRNRAIYGALLRLFEQRIPADAVTLCNELERTGDMDDVSYMYVFDVVAVHAEFTRAEHYARLVREQSERRFIVTFAERLASAAYDKKRSTSEILDEAHRWFVEQSIEQRAGTFMHIRQPLDDLWQRMGEHRDPPVQTGFHRLDQMIGGFQPGQLIIIGARPSIGKSAFGIQVSRHVATKREKSVAYFSLEMAAIEIAERMVAIDANVNMHQVKLSDTVKDSLEFGRITESVGRLSEAAIYIADTQVSTIDRVIAQARDINTRVGVDMIVVDYLQLMSAGGDNRTQEVSQISRGLKMLARDLNVPVVAMSQLSRKVAERSKKDSRPILSDLRESGSIEQDADVVIFIRRL